MYVYRDQGQSTQNNIIHPILKQLIKITVDQIKTFVIIIM